MPRHVRDAKIETRAARERLPAAGKPHWRSLDEGLHLGYRRAARGSGAWLVRLRTDAGRYRESGLGTADDLDDADGQLVLSFSQAQTKARLEWKTLQRRSAGLDDHSAAGPYTVAHALADYEVDAVRRGVKAVGTIKSTASTHILPALGSIRLDRLTTEKLKSWHAGIASAHAMVRSGSGKTRRHKEHGPDDSDAVRRRRSTANRILTVLKAALNFVFAEGKIETDQIWRRVKPFRGVDAARVRSLSAGDCTRLLDACDPAFRTLAQAAAMTGCRYGELCRLTAADVNLASGTVFVRESKSGKPRHVPLTDEGLALFTSLVCGKASNERVFLRLSFSRPGTGKGNFQHMRPWRASEADRFMRAASDAASLPHVRFHELRHAYASLLTSAGVPLAFVAEALGHADTRITSKHYAHLAPSSVANAIRGALPRFSAADSRDPPEENR